jgi:RNA polymerase sigma-70 factor (ECF subfamily)
VALRQEEFTSLCDDVDLDRDRALVERCQAGDSAAFGNLYARYYERLLRFCLRRLNDRHEAEDAAQEAFARAWKALPNFAGERRFYPWLTVIAGNICTDMLRRRSRSTPTEDLELGAQHAVNTSGSETSEELVLAAVDGELVNRALDRLSVRHRHVLAMREGSGWTYQQIADHEGVEIGTIETLLWRARQALKREFTVLSETKGALGGMLIGAGAFLRRGFLRATNRASALQQAGAGGGLRTAFAGVAVTSAAVAAAIVAPQAFSNSHPSTQSAISVPATEASNLAAPNLPLTAIPAVVASDASGTALSNVAGGSLPAVHGTRAIGSPGLALPAKSTTKSTSSGPSSSSPRSGGTPGLSNIPNAAAGALTPLSPALSPVLNTLGGVASALSNTSASGLASTLGLAQVINQLGLAPVTDSLGLTTPASSTSDSTADGTATGSGVGAAAGTTTTTLPALLNNVTSTVTSTVKSLLGHS